MTNIAALVTVTLATNVAEIFPQRTVLDTNTGPPGSHAFYSKAVPIPYPQEKWVTTSIVEMSIYEMEWQGKKINGVFGQRTITNWTVHYVIVPTPVQWERSTNQPPIPLSWPQ